MRNKNAANSTEKQMSSNINLLPSMRVSNENVELERSRHSAPLYTTEPL